MNYNDPTKKKHALFLSFFYLVMFSNTGHWQYPRYDYKQRNIINIYICIKKEILHIFFKKKTRANVTIVKVSDVIVKVSDVIVKVSDVIVEELVMSK